MTPRPPLFPYGPNVGLITRIGIRTRARRFKRVRTETGFGDWDMTTFVARTVAELARRTEPGSTT